MEAVTQLQTLLCGALCIIENLGLGSVRTIVDLKATFYAVVAGRFMAGGCPG